MASKVTLLTWNGRTLGSSGRHMELGHVRNASQQHGHVRGEALVYAGKPDGKGQGASSRASCRAHDELIAIGAGVL